MERVKVTMKSAELKVPSRAVNPWISQLPSYSLLKAEERKKKIVSLGLEAFDFGLGDPVEPTPQFLVETAIQSIPIVSQYPSSIGSMELRNSCAAWCERSFKVKVSALSQIISSNGSKEAIFHAPQILVSPTSARRIIVHPDPGFPVYKSASLLCGAVEYQVTLKPEKNYVFDPTEIPADILPQIAAVWVSYPHNPTGACATEQELEKIYVWCLKHNIVCLSDECYVQMYFEGSETPKSMLEISKKVLGNESFQNLMCFFSLSKRSGLTEYRSGFVAGDSELIGLFAKFRPHVGLGTPTFIQKVATAAWNEDNHAKERNRIFERKRKLVDVFLDKNNFEFVKTDATFYVWIRVPEKFATEFFKSQNSSGLSLSDAYMDALAVETGIVGTAGSALGESCTDWFRLALVPSFEKIEVALKNWQNWIDRK
jgi:succinyldiaminopimelate transaminase